MESPVSPIVANLYMEFLEKKALKTANNPPKFWKRFLDDTFMVQHTEHKENFLQHRNSIQCH